jgi:hypothetical protein
MAATLRTLTPPIYSPQVLPLLPGGEGPYTQAELRRLQTVLAAYQNLLPQASTQAPVNLVDGMIRLARSPWWPVAGQAADAWVYWDAAGVVWRYQATAPTTT